LGDDPEARRVVNSIVVSLRRYAELLQELLAPHRIAPAPADEVGVDSARHPLTSSVGKKGIEQHATEAQTAA
jgi:hypothetical protein